MTLALVGLLLLGGIATSAHAAPLNQKQTVLPKKKNWSPQTPKQRRAFKQAVRQTTSAVLKRGTQLQPALVHPAPTAADAASASSVTTQEPPAAAQERAAPAHPSTAQLNMVRTAPDQIGQAPSHFFWIRQDLQAVQDPLDGALVFLNDQGHVLGRARLPKDFEISEIVSEQEQIRLIKEGRQVALPRSLDPATTAAVQDVAVIGNGNARVLRLTRRGPQHLRLEDGRRAGARALDIRSVAGGQLAQAYEIGPRTGEARYVVSEEVVAARPVLQVRVFVQRFDRDGKLSGIAHVSLEGMDTVPRDFIAVDGDGVVRVLVPQSDGVKIREVAFAQPPGNRGLGDAETRNLGRTLREIPIDTNVNRPEGVGRFPRAGDLRFKVDVPMPPISRTNVIKNAMEYLSVDWVMAPENFSRLGITNECVPEEAKFWRRPTRFTSATIGQTIGPMPYRWGGDDTPATFRVRLAWGALAGSICTCRNPALDYCLSPESVGVDCSGFVSRAWGIEKRGTSGLLDVSNELGSLSELKPGDALNWPGRHVRLFVSYAPGAATAFTVIESSTRIECEGVCMRTYRPSELYGYRIIRYRGITD